MSVFPSAFGNVLIRLISLGYFHYKLAVLLNRTFSFFVNKTRAPEISRRQFPLGPKGLFMDRGVTLGMGWGCKALRWTVALADQW